MTMVFPLDHPPEVAARLGIEPGGGFIEEYDHRVVDERRRNRETLLLPAGELDNLRAGPVAQLHLVEQGQRIDAPPVHLPEQDKELRKAQLVEERRRLELDADDLLDLLGVRADVQAPEEYRSGVERPQGLDALERRRLPRAVGPQDPEDLPGPDAERHAVDRRHAGVPLDELIDTEDELPCVRHRVPLSGARNAEEASTTVLRVKYVRSLSSVRGYASVS